MDAHPSQSTSFSYSDFLPVKSRKNRKKRPPNQHLDLTALLAPLQEQIRQEEWFARCSHIIQNSWSEFAKARKPAILCLGLGSPSSSHIARVQLAFLTETCKRLDIDHDKVSIYDPIFTTEDTILFRKLQMNVLTKSRDGDAEWYHLSVPTICFMPHCDIELYDTVLRANWNREGLSSNLFLLGNRLQEYLDNKPTSVLETSVPYLLQAVATRLGRSNGVAALLESRTLPLSSSWPTAFNNTSVQYFRPSASADIDQLLAYPPNLNKNTQDETEKMSGEPSKG